MIQVDYSNSGGELGTLNLFELSALNKEKGVFHASAAGLS
mgnify:CR=1 FL=1